MVELLLHPANMPFAVALALMLCITFIEGAGSVLGFGFSEYLDNMVPDLDTSVDLDAPDVDGGSVFTRLFGWMRIKGVPLLIVIVVFLTSFGLIGLTIQSVAQGVMGSYLPSPVASAGALAGTIPVVKVFGRFFARFFPKDETEAVSEKSYIGKVAYITLGHAKVGSPAQAKLKDRYGTSHYIMVEPDMAEEEFDQGEAVLIVRQMGAVYGAIRNTAEELES